MAQDVNISTQSLDNNDELIKEGDLSYYEKYKPTSLATYIGNTKMKKSIMAALRGDSRPQVILLEGHAGTGKTSMARLLAKEYLCDFVNNSWHFFRKVLHRRTLCVILLAFEHRRKSAICRAYPSIIPITHKISPNQHF